MKPEHFKKTENRLRWQIYDKFSQNVRFGVILLQIQENKKVWILRCSTEI